MRVCVYIFFIKHARTHTHTHTRTHAHTHTHAHTGSKEFHGVDYNGKITKRSFEGLSSDAKPRYKVLYEDDDEEELFAEEIIPLLQVCLPACLAIPHTHLLVLHRILNENVSLSMR